MYVCIYKISFAFDTGRSFNWISLKLGRAVVCIENWCLDQFGPMRGELGVPQIRKFLGNEYLTTNFSEIQ